MKKVLITIGIIIIIAIILQTLGISVPHFFWPKKDIETSELNQPSLEKKVLIASRSSKFKNAIIKKLGEAIKNDSVYVKFTGLKKLRDEDYDRYNAIVLINTCMAGGMDPIAKNFLKSQKGKNNIVILTTSGGGDWLPKMKYQSFDAIASASEKDKVDSVANEIINKIRVLLLSK